MRVMLRLLDGLAAILEDHHSDIARGKIVIQALPEARNRMYLINRQLHKRAVMIAVINQHVSFSHPRLQRWEVIGMQPHLRIRAYFTPGNIFAEWAGFGTLAAIHAIGRVHYKLPQDRIPDRLFLFHNFPYMQSMLRL